MLGTIRRESPRPASIFRVSAPGECVSAPGEHADSPGADTVVNVIAWRGHRNQALKMKKIRETRPEIVETSPPVLKKTCITSPKSS